MHLGNAGLFDIALEMLDQASLTDPAYHHVHYLRGAVMMVAGNSLAAQDCLHKSLELLPGQAHVRWMLSMVDSTDGGETEVPSLKLALEQAAPASNSRAYLAFALHNRLHALGRYEEAWDALEEGCRVKRQLVPYNRAEQEELFDALMAMNVDDPSEAPYPEPAGTGLVFVVGMHRSGTSLVERVLSGHPEVADGGESYVLTGLLRTAADHFCAGVVDSTIVRKADELDYDEIREGLLAYAKWKAGGRKLLTEKLPSNFLNIGFILRALPGARIIHMRRDPIDTCFSNLRTFFGTAAPYSYDQGDLADYYLRYSALMQHWHLKAPGRILDVDYQAFVDDPESGARRMLEFCGLEFDPETLRLERAGGYSATASMAHVRQGILKNRGNAWKAYAPHLSQLISSLGSARGQC
jgi:tetratricopeptide (TPR) repeat protein